jgi:hypothetical protein
MSLRLLTHLAPPVLALAVLAAPTPAQAACTDPSNLCLETKGAKWEPDASLTAKQIKGKRKGANGTLSVKIEEGRGSVFIDGRFVGVAPIGSISLTPGKHDLQIRDGSKILAEGVITIPKGSTVRTTVRYP